MIYQRDEQANLCTLLHSKLDLTGKTGVERQLPDLMFVDSSVPVVLPGMIILDQPQPGLQIHSENFPLMAMLDDSSLI